MRLWTAALLLLTACATGEGGVLPSPTSSPTAPPTRLASTGPAATEWLSDLAAGGTDLYVASHRCPVRVAAGSCQVPGAHRAPDNKAHPLHLWRYTDDTWEDLGWPGASSRTSMRPLTSGLLLVPQGLDPDVPMATGPLRVSVNGGRTWQEWAIPQEQRRCVRDYSGPGRGPCTVEAAGDYVVIASNYGWVRRRVDATEWDDITPPQRAQLSEDDTLGYGLVVLPDGTLVATANRFDAGPGGTYRVSTDAGTTWSPPRPNPGRRSAVDGADGMVLLATCSKVDVASSRGTSTSECGQYRTTDLVHWELVSSVAGAAAQSTCRRTLDGAVWRGTEVAARVGQRVYSISSVPYVDGKETHDRPGERGGPTSLRRVLEASDDRCRTWNGVLGAS